MRIVRFIVEPGQLPAACFQPVWGVIDGEQVYPLRCAPWLSGRRRVEESIQIIGDAYPLESVRLLAPVSPSKLVCVGRNYAEHAAELGNEVPTEPLIFLKPPSTVVGPNAPVVYPSLSERVDHEGELAFVIGQRCRNVQADELSSVVFGYTVANDVTARDLQRKDGQWTRGKGFDTFAPIGPWIDTEFQPENRAVRCLVNGEMRQNGNTALLIYSLAQIVEYVTRFMTLEPGDIILTGTPAGVGPVLPGDVMQVVVEGLGTLSNPVVAE